MLQKGSTSHVSTDLLWLLTRHIWWEIRSEGPGQRVGEQLALGEEHAYEGVGLLWVAGIECVHVVRLTLLAQPHPWLHHLLQAPEHVHSAQRQRQARLWETNTEK